MHPFPFVVVLTTVPEDFDAIPLAGELVEQRLVACVNILPAMQSVYRWAGSVQTNSERQLVMKTSRTQVDALWTALRARHPYDVPEFVVLPILDGHDQYLAWIKDSTEVRGQN